MDKKATGRVRSWETCFLESVEVGKKGKRFDFVNIDFSPTFDSQNCLFSINFHLSFICFIQRLFHEFCLFPQNIFQ